MRLLVLALAASTLFAAVVPASAATFIFVNRDDPGVGFNDPTPVDPVGGNPGTTRGEQRRIAFQRALDVWGALLPSPVAVGIGGKLGASVSCDPLDSLMSPRLYRVRPPGTTASITMS